MASCALPAVCRPVKIDGVPYFDGGIADSIPVGRALEDGCDKLVVLLSKPRDYIRQPQKMKALYTLRCRAYPRIVEALDHRHTAYNLNLRKVYDLEKAGKAFIFAPETRVRTGDVFSRRKNRARTVRYRHGRFSQRKRAAHGIY